MFSKFFIFLKKPSFLNFFQERGYSVAEMLTTVATVGVLSVVGVRTYQAQTNKARSAEAKHSLSYVYTAERNFVNSWGTYHENLVVIGAVPSSTYHYDVGFGKGVTVDDGSTGPLENYPLTASLNIPECTNFYQICNGDCMGTGGALNAAVGTTYSGYFLKSGNPNQSPAVCTVTEDSTLNLRVYAGDSDVDISKADATASGFLALATGQLKNPDVWSIDDQKAVEHLKDGTQ